MDNMTDEEIDFALRSFDSGLDAEDIFERLNEQVPYGAIVELLSAYEECLTEDHNPQEDYYEDVPF